MVLVRLGVLEDGKGARFALDPDALEAAGAVDRVAVPGDKGNGGRLPALGAYHLGLGTVLKAESGLSGGAAGGTASGNVDQSFFAIELLLAGRPGERLAAFPAGQRAIRELHLTPSCGFKRPQPSTGEHAGGTCLSRYAAPWRYDGKTVAH